MAGERRLQIEDSGKRIVNFQDNPILVGSQRTGVRRLAARSTNR
jgi:hypothetical protein